MRVLSVLISVGGIYLTACAFMFVMQRALLYHPTSVNPRQSPPMLMSLEANGATLKVAVRDHAGPRALIYFGGNSEDVAADFPDFAAAFPQHAIYLQHYRGYSGSTGTPSEAALHADAQTLYTWVKSRHSEITVVGRSLGSGVAVRLAATHEVQRLVLITPYDSITNVARDRYPWLPVRLLLKDRFESITHAPLITAPTVVLLAEHDQVILHPRTLALHRAFAPGIATLTRVPGVDHNSISSLPSYFELMGVN